MGEVFNRQFLSLKLKTFADPPVGEFTAVKNALESINTRGNCFTADPLLTIVKFLGQ